VETVDTVKAKHWLVIVNFVVLFLIGLYMPPRFGVGSSLLFAGLCSALAYFAFGRHL
jgi:hypothetical protein